MDRTNRLILWPLLLGALVALAIFSSAQADHSVVERVSTGTDGGNGNHGASFDGVSQDGSHVFFSTGEKLDGTADTDPSNGCKDFSGRPANCRDIYERSAGVTTLISGAPGDAADGAFHAVFNATSPDGSRVFFTTGEPLLPEDADVPGKCTTNPLPPALPEAVNCDDIYEYSGGTTKLVSTVSTGNTAPNDDHHAIFNAIAANGTRVFFTTKERLVPADTDTREDVYMRLDGATTLISRGGGIGNLPFDARFQGVSQDGVRVFFSTDEALAPEDVDTHEDIYERRVTFGTPPTTTLISKSPSGTPQELAADFRGASQDGKRVFFRTREALLPEDADPPNACTDSDANDANCRDVYEYNAGTITLISGGNGVFDATYEGISQDGTRVFFTTREALLSNDTDPKDGCVDALARSVSADSTTDEFTLTAHGLASGQAVRFGGTAVPAGITAGTTYYVVLSGVADRLNTFKVSDTPGGAAIDFSDNGTSVTVDSFESCRDIYQYSGGTVTLISGGSGKFNASFDASSVDGSRVFFHTDEPLVGDNDDSHQDIYQSSGGITTLISAGGNGHFDASFGGASQDGRRVFFTTREPLVSADADPKDGCGDPVNGFENCRDVYERTRFNTFLVSTVPGGGNGAFDASFEGATLDGTRLLFSTDEKLLADDTDSSKDVYVTRPGADLSISVADSPDPVVVGEGLTYTLSVRNNGPLNASGVKVTDNLPAGASFDSATPSQGSCTQGGGTVTCDLGELADGAAATVVINVLPRAAGTFTNVASAETTETDPNAANNSDSEVTTVTTPPSPSAPAGPAGPAPSTSTGVTPRSTPKDTVAPTLAVESRSKQKLGTVVSKGLPITLKCLETCTVELRLELDRKTAKRLRLGARKVVVVGRDSVKLVAGKSKRVRLKLTRKAKSRLRSHRIKRGRTVTLSLRARVRDAAGNARTVSKKLKLRR